MSEEVRWLTKISLRLRSLFHRRIADGELDSELHFHLEQQIAANISAGMSPGKARQAALREFGGVEQLKEECRDMRKIKWLQDLAQDLRYGLRMLRKSPGFTAVAILTLALGIGANAAVFSWIEGLLLRPYPLVTHQERMYALVGSAPGGSYDPDISWPDFLDLQRNSKLVDSFIADEITGASLGIGSRSETATGSIVSANYFAALGVRPFLGRGFEPGEDTGRNAHPVVVISYGMWQNFFKSDRAIVGKTQRFNRVQFTIIGVAPENFHGTFVGRDIEFWVPASMREALGGKFALDDRSALD